jgi:hypothetical protein
MIIPLGLLISVAGVFHLMGIHSIGAIFTAISLIYGIVVGYLSIDKLPDRFFFANIYVLTFTLPGSLHLSHLLGYTFLVNVFVWFSSYFAGAVFVWIFFAWKRLDREILLFFLVFLLCLSVINFFSWANIKNVQSYLEVSLTSFRLFYESLLKFSFNPEFILLTNDISVQIFIGPFIFLVVSLFVIVKKF